MDPGNETSDFWAGYTERSDMLQPIRSTSQSNGISFTKVGLILSLIMSVLAIVVAVANLIISMRNSNSLEDIRKRLAS
jgi:hypothetical protein